MRQQTKSGPVARIHPEEARQLHGVNTAALQRSRRWKTEGKMLADRTLSVRRDWQHSLLKNSKSSATCNQPN
jgi:hypothetical protein